MKIKKTKSSKQQWSKYIVAAVGIVILIGAFLISQSKKPSNSEKQTALNQEENLAFTQEPVHEFNEGTRILTSPELLGNEWNEWGVFKFQLNIPKGWKVSRSLYSKNKAAYMLSITKDDVSTLSFNYGNAYGPGTCVFPGDKEPPEYINYLNIENFLEVKNGLGILRIPTKFKESGSNVSAANTNQSVTYSVCQLNEYGEWSTSTKLDQITMGVASNNPSAMAEAVNIIKSLKIIK